MPDLRWYVRRFAAMSPAEWQYRCRQHLRRELDRHHAGSWDDDASLTRAIVPFLRSPAACLDAFLDQVQYAWPGLAQSERVCTVLREQFPENVRATLEQAEAIRCGRIRLFSRTFSFDDIPDWHRDPRTGQLWPRRYWADIDIRDGKTIGGVKWIWELNRHQHLITLGKAYRLTGNTVYAQLLLEHIQDWMIHNPPYIGVNWTSSLELALRLISWIWGLFLICDAEPLEPEVFWRVIKGIRTQVDYIEHHLSVYSSANNHLIGEAAALFIVGVSFPGFRRAKHWRALGQGILTREIKRQIYSDGVPAEQAIHYLAFDLAFYELVMSLAQANTIELPRIIATRVLSACDFLAHIMDCGGNLPAFGDSDDGLAIHLDDRASFNPYTSTLGLASVLLEVSSLAQSGEFGETGLWLLGYEKLLRFRELAGKGQFTNWGLRVFHVGGYASLRNRRGLLVLDGGPLGYLSTAAHGHADALHVTLSLNGVPVLIDPGTYCYHEEAEWRDFFRSTFAHNTIVVDHRNQSRPGSTFLWIRKAQACFTSWASTSETSWVEAVHDGYQQHLSVLHKRRVYMLEPSCWLIIDRLSGKGKHHIAQFWHLASGVHIEPAHKFDASIIRSRHATLTVIPWATPLAGPQVYRAQVQPFIQGWASQHYGHKLPAPVIAWEGEISLPVLLATVLWPLPLDDFDPASIERIVTSLSSEA